MSITISDFGNWGWCKTLDSCLPSSFTVQRLCRDLEM